MHRRHHRDLSTTWGSGPTKTTRAPGDAASPRTAAQSDPEEPDVCPDVQTPQKRRRPPTWGHLPEVASSLLDVVGSKRCRFDPGAGPDPDASCKAAAPDVQPLNPQNVDPDVRRLEGGKLPLKAESRVDGEVPPKSSLFHPNRQRATLEVNSKPDVEARAPDPDVEGAKRRCGMLALDSDTDVEEAELPDAGCPKIQRTAPTKPRPPAVELEPPNPDVAGPQNGCQALLVDSDTDVELESSNSCAERPGRGYQLLTADSDTDVEGGGASPDVECPQSHRKTPKVPKKPTREVGPHNADVGGSLNGLQMLVVDSDTEVEEEVSNPDVECPESPRTSPREPDVQPGATKREAERQPTLLVESDTDVEEDPSSPDVGAPKPHGATQRDPRNPDVATWSRNPRAEGSQSQPWTLVVDSDTDVEENEVNPDVGRPKPRRLLWKEPDVGLKKPNPDVGDRPNAGWSLEGDSDTEVEGDELSQRVLHTRSHETPPNTPKEPTVVLETPNPDVGSLRYSSVASSGASDTDVEDLDDLPDAGAPGPRGATRGATGTVATVAAAPGVDPEGRARNDTDPDVRIPLPNPDVGAPNAQCLGVDSDTDVEDSGVAPDVGAVRGSCGVPGAPDVAVMTPDPDVFPPPSPWDGSDTDVEVVAPTPDVWGRRSRFQYPPSPDVVGSATGGEADVEETAPKGQKPLPKRQNFAPKLERAAGEDGPVPNQPDLTPNPGGDAPDPDVGSRRHDGETLTPGPAPPPDVPSPKSPRLAPNWGVTPDGDGGPRSAGAGVMVTEGDTDTEEDPDLFLEPTQSFLAPGAKGETPSWDPEAATQPFCTLREEEEEEEEEKGMEEEMEVEMEKEEEKEEEKKMEEEEEQEKKKEMREKSKEKEKEEKETPQDPPAEPVTVTPAQEGTGTGEAAGGEVWAGPRRSQRTRRGVAKGGGASDEGGALPDPAPVRRSPRLRARPPPPEQPITSGQSPAEPRPRRKPRPSRAGPAPPQRQEEEEEPREVAGPRLRPRRGPDSAPLKVLFTGVVASPAMEVALRTLGGSMATSVFDCTHLVTDRVRRTVKFLCAVARGVPIVTPEWLHKSAAGGRVVAPGPFVVRDRQQERHFGFSLAQALDCARRQPLLQGYEVHVTPSVLPEPEHMRDIVTCSGGTFLPTMPHSYGPRRLVISCEADAGCWAPALGARLPLATAELLLTGILRQRLQLPPFLLRDPAGDPPGDPSGTPRGRPPRRSPRRRPGIPPAPQ